jgi:hypothetical protein
VPYIAGVSGFTLVDHTRRHAPPEGQLDAIAKALTIQLHRDVAPAWGLAPREVGVGGRGSKVHVFDSSHAAGDAGYNVVGPDGLPYAHVYAGVAFEQGADWVHGADAISATASHEVLEMQVDPQANTFCFKGFRTLWAREVCDPVQDSTYTIRAGGFAVAVSNFVLPAYFDPWAPGPYDFLGHLHTAFSLEHGGYAVVRSASATREKTRPTARVHWSHGVPPWRRRAKSQGFGRTYWRLALGGATPVTT